MHMRLVCSKVTNSSGSILPLILGVLLLSGICLYTAIQTSTLYNSISQRAVSKSETRNAKTYLQLLFNVPSTCTNALLTGNFRSELQKKITDPTYTTDPNLTVYYPTKTANTTILFGPQTSFGRLTVQQVRLNIHAAKATPKSFVVDLVLDLNDGAATYALTAPFYVSIDANGIPNKCFFTDYINATTTLQDQLCATIASKNTIFDASGMKCVTGKRTNG